MKKTVIVITGPSGAGKSTLADGLERDVNIIPVRQTTTREPRIDDNKSHYRYVSIEQFELLQKQQSFAVSTGNHERRYGILKSDMMLAMEKSDMISIIASYKEINQILKFKKFLKEKFIVLTFTDIEKNVEKRIKTSRICTELEIKQRVNYALREHEKYFDEVKKFSDVVIYTDLCTAQETKNSVKSLLKLHDINRECGD